MPKNKLVDSFRAATYRKKLERPWDVLDKSMKYMTLFSHPLVTNTNRVTVKLYGPLLDALWMLTHEKNVPDLIPNYCMVKSYVLEGGLNVERFAIEMAAENDRTLLVTAKEGTFRASYINPDGTHDALLPFANESDTVLRAVFLALIPALLNEEAVNPASVGTKRLCATVPRLGAELVDVLNWTDKNDVPDVCKEYLYDLSDNLMEIFRSIGDSLDFGPSTATEMAELEDFSFIGGQKIVGDLIARSDPASGWEPKYLALSGYTATVARGVNKPVTISQAKQMFADFTAGRKWSAMEKMLIPQFDDDMPVMPEALWFAKRFCNTRKFVNPDVNATWRGVTSYGKTTGVRQVACMLNIPYVTITCFPEMELQDFKSTIIPESEVDGIMLDPNALVLPEYGEGVLGRPPYFEEALAHVLSLDDTAKKELLEGSSFFETALMDSSMAAVDLIGKEVDCDLSELCVLFTEVKSYLREEPLKRQLAAASASEQKEDKGTGFRHVTSDYMKALANGYLCEIQEASRIRSQGTLVGLNDYDRPGSTVKLTDGSTFRRHKDALCIITDNVGYESCNGLDPSVLRRFGPIIDSYELPKDDLLARIKWNTGCKDNDLLELAYKIWSTAQEYCLHNSITDGTVSATELELLVKGMLLDGPDGIPFNVESCIISKATSSLEDQKAIRSACRVLCPGLRAD